MLTRLKLLRLQREMLETRERRMLDPEERMTDRKERLMKESIRGAKFTSSKGSGKYKGARNPGNNSRYFKLECMSNQHRFFPDTESRLEEFNLRVEMARTQLENRLKQKQTKLHCFYQGSST